jgi:hypothetical protein
MTTLAVALLLNLPFCEQGLSQKPPYCLGPS